MTTVGYGDTFPITPLGKFTAGFTMLCGILLLAFPVGVLSAKFGEALIEELDLKESRKFVKPRSTLTIEQKYHCLEKYLREFDDELETVRDTCSEVANMQASMAKVVDDLLFQYDT